jgi:23S rRNA pseudouridine1911/1915/1917 synthase
MLALARPGTEDDDEFEASYVHAPEEPAVPARVIIPAGSDGERLDKVLARLLPDFSRSRIKQWIEEGAIRLNDRVPTVRSEVLAGDTVDLAPPPSPQAIAYRAEAIPLDVVHVDDSIIVLDKPAGLVVHPAAGNWSGTLLNGLLAYDPAQSRLPRAGIVHRLDADTSGLMVVARTEAAQTNLVRQLQARTVTREYWAIVFGTAQKEGSVEGAIARDPRQPVRFKVSAAARAKPARTVYRRIATTAPDGQTLSWLTCRLETGRTHQIRVHLESIGHSLVGDPVYRRGRPATANTPHAPWATFDRQALHAYHLGLTHPRTGESMQWVRQPPDDMSKLMRLLGFDPTRAPLRPT